MNVGSFLGRDIASKGWLDDLKHANAMAGAPPGWQAPCFKPKEVLKESSSTSKAPSLRFDVPPVPVSSEAPSKTLEALDAAWSEEIPKMVYTDGNGKCLQGIFLPGTLWTVSS